MELPKYIVMKVDCEPKSTTVTITDISDRCDVIEYEAEQTEPQTEEWHDDCNTCRWHDGACTIPCCDYEPKTEPQLAEKCPFDDSLPCKWVCTEYGKCKYKPKTEPIPHDDYIESGNDHLEARCLNCHNAKDCKENHWEVCEFEPWKLTAVDDEPQTERESD